MDLGIFSGPTGRLPDPQQVTAEAAAAHEQGFGSYWIPQMPWGADALVALAVAGTAVPDIELGTAVIPTYSRHPITMAQQAATTSMVIGEGRLALGIGLSHKPVIEGQYGIAFDRPVRHLREYLEILGPQLRNEKVSYGGDLLTGRNPRMLTGAPVPQVLVAALGPQMLRLTGRLADGTITWMTGNNTLREHTIPTMCDAAEEAGRPRPRTAVGLPVCCTDDVDGARELAARLFSIYGTLPSYRAMLDREGLTDPQDICVIGGEDELATRLAAVFETGADTVLCAEFGPSDDDVARTRECLRSLLVRP
jgi:5,10-methylenetetrahydromethanopterin reductase